MRSLIKMACSRHIMQSSLSVSAVVGTILNIINQGAAIISATGISSPHIMLNYFVAFCVASYSAAKNELSRISL